MGTTPIVRFEPTALGSCDKCCLQYECLARGWDPESVQTMGRNVRRGRPLSRKDHLYRQGEPVQALYILRSGALKSYLCTEDGLEQVVRFYLPGAVLGLDALEQERHTTSAQALEASSVCWIDYTRLDELCRRYPRLQLRLFKAASREISLAQERAVLLTRRAAEERLAAFLLHMSDYYAKRGFSPVEFHLPMSRQDIASHLALAVETVSRLLTNLQNTGLVRVERRFVRLASIERVRALACPSRACSARG